VHKESKAEKARNPKVEKSNKSSTTLTPNPYRIIKVWDYFVSDDPEDKGLARFTNKQLKI
jgi:hypothetical protein